MHAHGIDIVEISRIGAAIDSWGDRFLKRIYTEGEIRYCRGRLPQLAARFAGKEAVMKALGTGNRRVSWRDIEILPDRRKAPLVYLNGRARSRADELGIDELAISLSHSREYAIASVVGGKSEDSHR
ncbi:holo-ACP synthase [Dehalococcoidia bacterium]|nr:holo-ACP synthase [Dehalococcoidia bacterium]